MGEIAAAGDEVGRGKRDCGRGLLKHTSLRLSSLFPSGAESEITEVAPSHGQPSGMRQSKALRRAPASGGKFQPGGRVMERMPRNGRTTGAEGGCGTE